MKRFIVFASCLLTMQVFGYLSAQPVSIVSAPALEGIATTNTTAIEKQTGIVMTMNSVIQQLEAAESKYKDAMKKATWMRNLNSARRLLFMVENLVCTSKDINIKIGLADAHSSCILNYKFDISIAKLEMTADYLGILLTDGISMTQGERMQVMSTTQVKFEEAQDEFLKISNELDAQATEREVNQAIYEGIGIMMFKGKKY
jgi:hypothetical protein